MADRKTSGVLAQSCAGRADAGVVDQDVDVAELRSGRVRQIFAVLPDGDVGAVGKDSGTCAP
jgi:hypothetical protein